MGCPPTSRPCQHVGQPNRIDVENSCGIRDVTQRAHVAGDAKEIAQPHCVRAQQVRLDSEQVLVAARILEHGLDPGLLLDENG
jgi:hypothetical protein